MDDAVSGALFSHSPAFRRRRFFNWFPLGLIYSFYYMTRYNLSKANTAISDAYGLTNAEFGIVITAGFWTYAVSFLINGPLTDKVGGKRAILIGAGGTILMNLIIGLLIGFSFPVKIVLALSLLYALNMYFQSFGAVSIVKVNAAWFHVRERGVFGGIFGVLISFGYWLAYGVGAILLAKLPLMYIFIVPSLLIFIVTLAGAFLVKDRPSQAGFDDFDTGDASSGDHTPVSIAYVVRKVFTNRVTLTIAAAEFFTGYIRNSIMQWFPKYVDKVYGYGKGAIEVPLFGVTIPFDVFGIGLFLVGIAGGISAGWLSDRFFGSRRPPVAMLYYLGIALCLVGLFLADTAAIATACALGASLFFVGIHGLLSGTSSMDFGGRKAAATAAGLIDGMVYLGSGIAGIFVGGAIDLFGWHAWPLVILPATVVGMVLTYLIRDALPKGSGGH